jgi:ribosomal protein S18
MAWFDVHMNRLRPKILEALAKGAIEDRQSGRATGMLAERLEDEDAGYVSNALLAMEKNGEVVREVNGRRTYVIRLPRPDDDMEAIKREVEARVQVVAAQRTAGVQRKLAEKEKSARVLALVPDESVPAARGAVTEPPPSTSLMAPTGPPPSVSAAAGSPAPMGNESAQVHPSVPGTIARDNFDYGKLAGILLEKAIDAANTPVRNQRELADAVKRLGEQTEETQRLRRKERELQDIITALKSDNEHLRTRAQRAEENLNKMTGLKPLDHRREQELKELARTMAAKPGAYAGNVDRRPGEKYG